MRNYYLYLLDADGHINAREILTIDNDAEAICEAKTYLRDHPLVPGIELWLGERQVTALKQTAAA